MAGSATKPTVLLIEAGGDNAKDEFYIPGERFSNVYKNWDIGFRYQTTPQLALGGRVLPYLRGKGLGGSTIANHLTYTRGARGDYDFWAELVGDDAWSWNEVLKHFKSLENLHFHDDPSNDYVRPSVDKHGYDGPVDISIPSKKEWLRGMDVVIDAAKDFGYSFNPDNNSGDPLGMSICYTTSYNGKRTTSATAYLQNPPSNLTMMTHTVVTGLVLGGDSASNTLEVTGVRLRNGRELSANKEVIMAAGGIDTPRLLMLSGIGPALDLIEVGIKPVLNAPYVGKNLSDHCYTTMTWVSDSEISDAAMFNCNKNKLEAARSQWLRDRTGPMATRNLPNIIAFLKLDRDRYPNKEIDLLDDRLKAYLLDPTVPQYEMFFQGPPHPDLKFQDGEDYFDVGIGMLPPLSKGTVKLASRNPDVPALIDSRFLTHPYDRRTFIDSIRDCLRFINSSALARHIKRPLNVPASESDDDILHFLRETVLSVLHASGTVKMGAAADPTACVDTDFRFRGVRGLRVVDLSIAPIITK